MISRRPVHHSIRRWLAARGLRGEVVHVDPNQRRTVVYCKDHEAGYLLFRRREKGPAICYEDRLAIPPDDLMDVVLIASKHQALQASAPK